MWRDINRKFLFMEGSIAQDHPFCLSSISISTHPDSPGNFMTVMALLCALLTGLGMVFAPQLTAFFADGYDAGTAELCAQLTRVMMPTELFTGVAFSFVGVLFRIPSLRRLREGW